MLFYVILSVFLKNCMLSRESYVFTKVTAENHMGYDITAEVLQNEGKGDFYRFY